MSRYNGKFGRTTFGHAAMLKAGGHLSGSASPLDPEQPAPQMPPALQQAAETRREQPIYRSGKIKFRAPRVDLEGPA